MPIYVGPNKINIADIKEVYVGNSLVYQKESQSDWYEHEDWWNYCSNGVSGQQAIKADIGKIVNLTINGQVHKVRLIGINHDDLADGSGKAHCTFQFVNIISDSNGYCLATYWKNTRTLPNSNRDFLNSSVRKALTGEGNGDLHWFEKDSKTFSETYANQSVYDMLPSDFKDTLKVVKKKVNINNDNIWTLTEYTDKLFLLTPKEMGYSDQYSEDVPTYKHYEGHTSQVDAIRIKKQVKGLDGARTEVLEGTDLDGEYWSIKCSHAGYNNSTESYGCSYWTSSPYMNDSYISYFIGSAGVIYHTDSVFDNARGVAPAFCI